jgi:LytS/YehU family sensor histidine kinase
LELLKNYLALEKSRFNDLFDYEIEIDNKLKNNDINIPSMLIQPFIENAIWHGLRYRTNKGMLCLSLQLDTKTLVIKIQDNGIGIAKSKELKTKNQLQHKGRGMNNTLERIKLLNELYQNKINYTIEDSENGVLVTLKFKEICK